MRKNICLNNLIALIVIAAAVTCCTPKREPEPLPPAPPPKPVMIEHVVQYSGETLGLIARWYTGKTANWQRIVDANPGLVPERINLGDRILIPEEIVVERSPLPKRAVKAALGKGSTDGGKETVTVDAERLVETGDPENSEEVLLEESSELGDAPLAETEIEAIPEASEPEPSVAELVEMPDSEESSEVAQEKPEEEVPADGDEERERLLDELLAQ